MQRHNMASFDWRDLLPRRFLQLSELFLLAQNMDIYGI